MTMVQLIEYDEASFLAKSLKNGGPTELYVAAASEKSATVRAFLVFTGLI